MGAVAPALQPRADAAAAAGQQPASAYELELRALEDYRCFCALTIQRFYRGWIVRHRARKQAAALSAATATAAAAQAVAGRQCAAARAIQDAWRAFRSRRIFRFYADLIKSREAADPRVLLRCINAPEAALIEPAAGLHVRLRLSGPGFPPVLVYKVFTHRPVTDICAFAPRDYVAEAAAARAAAADAAAAAATAATSRSAAAAAAGCSSGTELRASRRGWYRRADCNCWRPVVELQQPPLPQLLPAVPGSAGCKRHGSRIRSQRERQQAQQRRRLSAPDGQGRPQAEPAACCSDAGREAGPGQPQGRCSSAALPFHHCPLVRRAERACRMKHRRRQWLLKMYQAGAGAAAAGASGSLGAPAVQQPGAAGRPCSGQAEVQQRPQAQQPEPQPRGWRCSTDEEQLLAQLEAQLLPPPAGPGPGGACAQPAGARTAAVGAAASADISSAWPPDELVAAAAGGADASILAWCAQLDFEAYSQLWVAAGLSAGSEARVPRSEAALLALAAGGAGCG